MQTQEHWKTPFLLQIALLGNPVLLEIWGKFDYSGSRGACLSRLHCLTKIFPYLSQNLPLFRFFHTHCPLLSSAFTTLLPSIKLDDRLKNKRKIVLRQAEAHLSHTVWVVREEIHVEKGWRTPAKRALLERVALQYQSASGSHKQCSLLKKSLLSSSLGKMARRSHGKMHNQLAKENALVQKWMTPVPTSSQKEALAASDGNGCRPHPRFLSNRLRFCPAAITNASQLTFQRRLKRKRRIPCHSFASPNKGSTQTFRLRSAF